MKCLFVHDHTGHVYNDRVYTEHFSYDMWKERYLSVFDTVNVLCRTKYENQSPSSKMVLATGEGIHYLCKVNDFHGPFAFVDRKIKQVVREEVSQSDVIILRLDSFLGLMAAKECNKQKKPYLVEVAGCAWDSFWNHGLTGKAIAPYIFLRTRREIARAPFVVYVTSSFLQKRYPNRNDNTNCSNVFLPDHVEEDIILKNRIDKIRACHNESTERIVIGTTAHYDVKYKGQQYVIRALANLKKKGIDCFVYELVGNGTGNYLKNLARELDVSKCVVFKGALPHANVLEWLDTIDVYIQPSKQEGLPRSVIEAMSRGVPCFGARTAGIPELIHEPFLFSNKRNNYLEIAALLEKNKNMSSFEEYAKEEMVEARKYKKAVIEERRQGIFKRLKKAAENSKRM